jgi:hypothetical protein
VGRRLNYANVTATVALFFAMSGGALAAKHYLISSTKQISPKVLKALKGNEGSRGFVGATGGTGATGNQGPAGKEGKEGKEGPKGSAIAYADIGKTASLISGSGVVDAKRKVGFPAGDYCIYGNFTPNAATATFDWQESAGAGLGIEVGLTASAIAGCPASGTGAPAEAIVLTRDKTSALIDESFFVVFD